MKRLLIVIILILTLFSCNNSELENENRLLREELEDTKSEIREANQTITDLSQQLSDLSKKNELENKAESLPLEYEDYGFTIKNRTHEGTSIDEKGPFEQSKIRFINISTYFKNNLGELGRNLYGSLYIRYTDPYGSTVGGDNYFYQRNGSSLSYSFKKEINSSSSIVYYGSGWGSNTGGTYNYKGKYKVEFWFDKDNNNKAYKLCETSFEVY